MTERKKVIIDTDPGIDDALAMLLLLLAKQTDVLAVTTVAGNKDLQTVTDNATTVAAQARSQVPIYSGSAAPLVKELRVGQVMGETGLGQAERITGIPLNGLAVEKLVELVSENPGEVTIVAIGPLTNIARAMQIDSTFASNLKELVMMGGAIESYGNMNRVAEFNFFVDPEAADLVLAAACRKVLITLDRSYEIPLFVEDFALLEESAFTNFIMAMVIPYMKNLARFEGQPGAIVYDALAAYYLLNPAAYELEPFDIRVETDGKLTRGMCVVEKRPGKKSSPNVDYVSKIDKDAFKRDFFEVLNQEK